MEASPSSRTTLPDHAFREPTEPDARAALTRVFGSEAGEALWSRACARAGLVPGGVDAGDPLAGVAAALCEEGGAAAMVGRSIEIRMRTHARLARSGRAAAGSGGDR